MIKISVVIPVQNEEKNIVELVTRLTKTLNTLSISYEVIFVTDRNEDNTYELLKTLHAKDDKLKIIKLSHSYGQHIAVFSGLKLCSGNAAVIMDGDLQDCPEDLPKLYNKFLESFDIVYGEKERKNDSFIRNFFSTMFVKTLNLLSDKNIRYNTSMFRIVSRRTIEEILRFTEIDPNVTFLMSFIAFPSTSVMVTSGQRKRGKTKYNFLKTLGFGINAILSFSTKPLRGISTLGLIISTLSMSYMLIMLGQKFFLNINVSGWMILMTFMAFLSGIQLLALGIIGEYLRKIVIQTKNRPLFIIEEKIGKFL